MNFTENSTQAVDSELQQFLEAETQKRRFKLLVHGLTDRCWDVCVEKVNVRLEEKTEKCMINCVERFIDTTNFIVNRLEKSSESSVSSSNSLTFE